MDRALRKLVLQLPHSLNGWIGERGHAEEQLVLARVVLAAMAAEAVDHPRIESLEGFKYADARRKGR